MAATITRSTIKPAGTVLITVPGGPMPGRRPGPPPVMTVKNTRAMAACSSETVARSISLLWTSGRVTLAIAAMTNPAKTTRPESGTMENWRARSPKPAAIPVFMLRMAVAAPTTIMAVAKETPATPHAR